MFHLIGMFFNTLYPGYNGSAKAGHFFFVRYSEGPVKIDIGQRQEILHKIIAPKSKKNQMKILHSTEPDQHH